MTGDISACRSDVTETALHVIDADTSGICTKAVSARS